ncbi:hypothetical protein GC56T2_0227 [Geobacillus sp. C56-T2]|nr:hypothetical protein GC56T2_0227 [Geobacillus sp. C56-T2]
MARTTFATAMAEEMIKELKKLIVDHTLLMRMIRKLVKKTI